MESETNLSTPDKEVICMLNKKRLLLPPPMASNFRVLCLMMINTKGDVLSHILGMNFEPANIAGSICAERSALGQLHLHDEPTVKKIFIVTDADEPISPGCLCREFLTSKVDDDTPIVLADCTGELIVQCTIRYLFPYPFLYRTTTRNEIEDCAESFLQGKKSNDIQDIIKSICGDKVSSLYGRALNATKNDGLIKLHPLKLGAGILYADGTIDVTWQLKALEYGCTLDPVAQLVTYLERNQVEGRTPEVLLMVDQYGIVHAPFGQARAILSEHGYGELKIVVMRSNSVAETVLCSTLVPKLDGYSGSLQNTVF